MKKIVISDIKGAIFDMDGVLLDSMPMWDHAGEMYLAGQGIQAEPDLEKVLFTMTMMKGAEYMQKHYGLELSAKEIIDGINETVRDFYANKVEPKSGVPELLRFLKRYDIPVTVATSTDRCHVEAALVRTGLMKYVDRIFTCSEVGVGKAASPKIYEMAAEFMGTPASDTFVFEDAYHAAETAQNGGFVVVGLYDESSRDRQGDLIAHCDHYFKSMDDMLRSMAPDRSRLVPVLTIAGSDSSGGAGVQADLKTMQANGVFGMSAITALTAQNTTGVTDIMNVTPDVLGAQIDAVFTDIRPKAVKIGMVSVPELIDVIADRLARYNAENVVLDPVMVATSGAKLISDDAVEVMTGKLFPLAKLITPNIPETEALTGISVKSVADMENAARCIYGKYGCAVLVKGGHSINDANDMLFDGENITWFSGERIDNPNTHGTGCTLSSAIASNLAKEYDVSDSVRMAKQYISGALAAMLDLGSGSGPLNHGFDIRSRYML